MKTLKFKKGQWTYEITLSDEEYARVIAGEHEIDMESLEGYNLQDGVKAFYMLVLGKYGLRRQARQAGHPGPEDRRHHL